MRSMMFERFGKDSKAVVLTAREEAMARGASTLEAEHLLLALARRSESDTGRALAAAGLDYEGVWRALELEFEQSLAAVGVPAAMFMLDAMTIVPPAGAPRWGASARLALRRAHRAVKTHGGRTLVPSHLLLGILSADAGTVPRALTIASIDAEELAANVAATLR
jgi:ATP-dependent Clp protease ATP-binding subunit ClpA